MTAFFKIKRFNVAVSSALIAVCCLNFFADAQTKSIQTNAAGNLTPVVLIHGIGGSDLRRAPQKGETAKSKSFLRDGFPNDVLYGLLGKPTNLQFDETGKPRVDTVSKELAAAKFYDVPQNRNITDLSKFLVRQGYVRNDESAPNKNANLFEFYYDFRFSVPQIAARLAEFISRVKKQTGAPQVDLIGHSLGGVVVKQYLLQPEAAANVRVVIFAATPHLGAPKTLKALRYGDDLNFSVIDECKLKRAVHNMPGMFNLLPGKRYFEISGGGYFIDAADSDGDGATGELDYEHTLFNLKNGAETKCLMKPEKNDAPPFDRLSADLIRENVENFRSAQDDWAKPPNTKVFVIAGYNVPTLKTIREDAAQITYTFTNEGDGSVPLLSAEICAADAVYYADFKQLKTDHSQMIGSPEIDLQIYKLLVSGAGVYVKNLSNARPDAKQFLLKKPNERVIKINRRRQI